MRMEWSPEDLIGSWTLVEEDWRLIGNKSGPTRLGFALVLKFFEIEAAFPTGGAELPPAAVDYVSEQVGVVPALLGEYPWAGRTVKYHRAQVREAFGFREFARADEEILAGWLVEQVCPVEQRDDHLREALLVRCRSLRIEPPGRPGGSSARRGGHSRNGFAGRPSLASARSAWPGWRPWSPTRRTKACWRS